MTSKSKTGALKVLQNTTSGSNLVGGKERSQKNSNPKQDSSKKNKLTNIFTRRSADDKSKVLSKDASVETIPVSQVDAIVNTEVSVSLDPGRPDSPSTIREMLLGARPNERYFELLAEERRKALDEALRENLWLSQEVARLKEENRDLQAVAEEGMKYAEILKEALKEEEEDGEKERD